MGEKILLNDLRVARARREFTQASLAEAVGVTRKTINSIENGRYVPSTYLALLLAKVLETSVESLFQLASATEESRDTGHS